MADSKALVIRYGKKSYVHVDSWRARHGLLVNGRSDWPPAPGDASFVEVSGAVQSVAAVNPPQTVTVKYTLRPDLACASKPGFVTAAEYEALPESARALYVPVTETREQAPTPFELEELDGLAAPRRLPEGVTVETPHHLSVWSWFWWTLPCTASQAYTFGRLRERVAALNPDHFAVTVYSYIHHLRVEAHGLTLGGVTWKPERALVSVDRDASSGGYGAVRVPVLVGENLDHLLAKVEAWVDEVMRPVTEALAVKHCQACRRPTRNPPALSAKSSRARRRHVIE